MAEIWYAGEYAVLRLCVVVLPLAWLFAQLPNAAFMIWWAFPIAEFVAFLAAAVLALWAGKRVLKPMEARG